ncbi:hypothetical protein, partial [Enterobacter cloacae]|uniref:hypothetical protein n=1 Tax=Enterobacter cloacae TaxID=550 RepID=UPI001E4739D9
VRGFLLLFLPLSAEEGRGEGIRPHYSPPGLSPGTYLANEICDLPRNVIYNKLITFNLQGIEFLADLTCRCLWQEYNHNDRKHYIERDAGCQ